MQTANGGPPQSASGAPQQAGSTRSLLVTAAVCLASLVAVGALSGRRLLSGVPLVLSSPVPSAVELPLDHHADAVRRSPIAAPDPTQFGAATSAPDPALAADGPSIEQMAREMTARALAKHAADPSRVQLLPQAASITRAEPPASADAPGSGHPAALGDVYHLLDTAGGAVTAGEDAARSQQSLSADASEAGIVTADEHNASASALDAVTVDPSREDIAVQHGAQAGSALAAAQSSMDAAGPSAASDAGQADAQRGPESVLGEQAVSPEDLQSALVSAAFAEGVIASQAAAAEAENPPPPQSRR